MIMFYTVRSTDFLILLYFNCTVMYLENVVLIKKRFQIDFNPINISQREIIKSFSMLSIIYLLLNRELW